MEDKYSRKICLATNYNCNLNCIYCYEKEKQNINFDADEALNLLKELLSTKTEFGTKIKLHGGEPFLAFKDIKKVCEGLWNTDVADYYHFHITTNGTLIHGEIQEWLKRHSDRISVKLSIDGNRFSHNLNRSNSFDSIDLPFFISTWNDLSVNMTITPQTIPYLAENVKFLHSAGVKHIISHFALIKDWNNCGFRKTLYEQMSQLIDFYIQNPQVSPCHLFKADISSTLDKPCFRYSCTLSESPSYDFQSRKYYPCYMCFPSMAGEEMSKKLLELDFTDTESIEEEGCRNCPFINICVTCYADNYISRGALSKRDMCLCSYHKVIFAALFKYEYERIIRLDNPTSSDIRKMQAIQKWAHEINSILTELS
ncbi:MAG: radical SAM protein [Bacteroidales bacterium]|nr:radical SAM protein [Bacteroidales bacterium]